MRNSALVDPSMMLSCAGNRLSSLASLSYTQFASSLKSAALLAAGTDDLVCVYRVNADRKVSGVASLLLQVYVVNGGANLLPKCS